ncbi:MAG: DUF4011 domain-containing protein [Flavobacteriales bacterium]|nr:DUF4011 domain-containing protein [Flavobacteriales bacterium]
MSDHNKNNDFFGLIHRLLEFGFTKNPDFIAFTIPLLEQVKGFHELNRVANILQIDDVVFEDNVLKVSTSPGFIRLASSKIFVKPIQKSGILVDQGYVERKDLDSFTTQYSNKHIRYDDDVPINEPVYIKNYRAWETELGHNDPLTDIYVLGLILASVAYGLDFRNQEDLEKFVNNRNSLYFLNPSLHATMHDVIFQMTQLYREDRIPNLQDAIDRIVNYREYNPENLTDLTKTEGFRKQDISNRNSWILSKLKNRLFDTSRRNKLLYFKEQLNFMNLTIASVPLLLDYKNIREKDLIFWNETIKNKIVKSKKLVANDFIDFEQNRFLEPTLNQIRLDAQKSLTEYGFSQLRIVVAFLHWYNFKENETERITSPLLLLPATLSKKKGVRDRHILDFETTEAEVNPVLSNFLKELYGIQLPDFVDLESSDLEDLIQGIEKQIAAGGTGIRLELRKTPKIKLIHSIARKNFNLRTDKLIRRTSGLNVRSFNYSYQKDEFVPLGLQIFKDRIKYKNNSLEYLINEDLSPRNNMIQEKERVFYANDNEGELNPLVWEVDACNLTLGNFNYRKMSLVRDFNQIIDSKIEDKLFEQLFSELPLTANNGNEALSRSSLTQNYPIISADPTQTNAIELARSGTSYIIQGPPGTGKSQTITNLIADFIARDKKILFVCEKRAALDVVFHRLKNKQLDELCCLIHDSQADKKPFIMNLKDTYEGFMKSKTEVSETTRYRQVVIQAIEQEMDVLQKFHSTMKTGDHSPIRLFEILHAYKPNKEFLIESELIRLPDYAEWNEHKTWISEWMEQLRLSGLSPVVAQYAFRAVAPDVANYPNSKLTITELLHSCIQQMDYWLEFEDDSDVEQTTVEKWQEWFALSKRVKGIVSCGKMSVFDAKSDDAKELLNRMNQVNQLQAEYEKVIEKNKHWITKWEYADVDQAMAQWQNMEKSILRFVNPTFYRIKKELKASYNFSAHKIKPDISAILANLNEEHLTKQRIIDTKQFVIGEFGLKNWEEDVHWIQQQQRQPSETLRSWMGSTQMDWIQKLVENEESFAQFLKDCEMILGNISTKTFDEVDAQLQLCLKQLPSFTANVPFIQKLGRVNENLKNCLLQKNWETSDFEFHTAYRSLKDIYDRQTSFSITSGETLDTSVRRINGLLSKYYEANVQSIKAQMIHKFKDSVRITEAVAAQLTTDEKVRKKELLNARRILENEFGKTMRYKSVRELAADANSMLTILKPVWLMSPLSVSDTMPIDTSMFDVVIFDEASQITVEEGVPSLFRTGQTIIVGDEMQMPPTNFFGSATTDDEDDAELHAGITLDADSLLNQGARKLPSVMLGWHYRSRHESLISFSNAAFYKRELLTIPDVNFHSDSSQKSKPVVDIEAEIDLKDILSKSISYHFLENGTYSKRTNSDEARYIARLVKMLLNHPEKRSIGIVAFSMEQQSEIESAINNLTIQDKDFESKLEAEYKRMDDDQFNGLFIKNLENVQGDERDIIILSICYGYNTSGKMLMNFGPINRRGGEKRLNVIFSRARKNMIVVTSIQAADIKNDYNEGANYFKRFLAYSQAISEGRIDAANGILDSMTRQSEEVILANKPIIQQIKNRIHQLGYQADTGVGQSYFKCDLAVRFDSQTQYRLGILIDHGLHYKVDDVVEQYCQKPEILKSFGWKILRVYYKDWLDDPNRVMERVVHILENDKDEFEVVEENLLINEQKIDDLIVELQQNEPAQLVEETIEELNEISERKSEATGQMESFQRLEFSEGTSNKYWEIGVNQNRVIVRYGRIGNNPQINEKEFDSHEIAQREKGKMIEKKQAKGYKKV